jgi:L-ribulose-5-phosphate 3-epimerase UlaE
MGRLAWVRTKIDQKYSYRLISCSAVNMWVTTVFALTLYSEIIAVCSEIHTKHINTLCGQHVEFVNVKLNGTYRTTGLNETRYQDITSGTTAIDFTLSLTNFESNFTKNSELISFDIQL